MSFPLTYLPQELAHEILRLAVMPLSGRNGAPGSTPQADMYKEAVALASVSFDFRQAVMSWFLQSVILKTQEQVHLFVRTLEQQEYLKQTRSRLHLDYKRHVRRLWSSEYWAPLAQGTTKKFENPNLLYDIFRGADVLGFNFDSLHLLYEILGGIYSESLPNWNCSKIIFGGQSPLWNSLTSTTTGLLFLGQLTHLTIWSPPDSQPSPLIPSWVGMVPFSSMPNLRHFAFSINNYSAEGMSVITYNLPANGERPTIFRTWAFEPNPMSYGSLSCQAIGTRTAIPSGIWETCFLLGENA